MEYSNPVGVSCTGLWVVKQMWQLFRGKLLLCRWQQNFLPMDEIHYVFTLSSHPDVHDDSLFVKWCLHFTFLLLFSLSLQEKKCSCFPNCESGDFSILMSGICVVIVLFCVHVTIVPFCAFGLKFFSIVGWHENVFRIF